MSGNLKNEIVEHIKSLKNDSNYQLWRDFIMDYKHANKRLKQIIIGLIVAIVIITTGFLFYIDRQEKIFNNTLNKQTTIYEPFIDNLNKSKN
jgi:hypothetical protein